VPDSCGSVLRRLTFVLFKTITTATPAGIATLLALISGSIGSEAQIANRLPQTIDSARTVMMRNHHPQWANAANSVGAVPTNQMLDQFTLVLTRSAAQEQAFEQLLADQQNPASPQYHRWLTPQEVGERFGVSNADLASVEGWLQSRGLRVNWVSPSRTFVGFGGTAADVGRAFGTELRYYSVNGAQRMSVASDPQIPQTLAPVIGAVRGLFAVDEQPAVRSTAMQSAAPELTSTSGNHYIAPADFARIYDLPAGITGAGVTVGIVSWSRTNFADFDNFREKTGTSFANPTEIIPPGGIDPGPAYTTPQSCSNCLSGQMEATLDVQRVGSTAPGANILLVVSPPSGNSSGISAAAQYLVNTNPVPAQVMSISFGACEQNAGPSGVAFWNNLFQQAAAEGISAFVSSGDSGASGCDTSFAAPPPSQSPNSPNYICSSQYATCVGGTQFNDAGSPSTYWNSINSPGLLSVLGYIPEGGWNESTTTSVAASGGGVSTVIPTPSWQTGAGVPAARAGRYTPDISFSASAHDGYFGCFAATAGGASCAGNPFPFAAFAGTSASAPGMAGVAAMLVQKLGNAQGNLNPTLYGLAASNPAAFHDVTAATSGVAGCDVNTVSICNNSIPNRITGIQAGYQVGTAYDQVTGLGSLDISAFLNSAVPVSLVAFTVDSPAITVAAGATKSNAITVTPVNGFTGNVVLSASITSTPTGAVNLPTLTFGSTSPVNITSTSQQTATLTITTTAPQQGACTASSETPRSLGWPARGGAVLACVLLFGIRSRRRRFRASLGMLALLVVLASGVLACGGSMSTPCTPTTIAGTTPGNYTITLAGTSATASTSRTVTLTVQ
jgi:subtilase family serine protease